MEDKAAAARRAYNQAYYRRNREKIRQQQAEYWKRKAEELETIKKGNNDGNQRKTCTYRTRFGGYSRYLPT